MEEPVCGPLGVPVPAEGADSRGLGQRCEEQGERGWMRPGKGAAGSGSAEVAVRTGTCPLGASGASGESGSDSSGCRLQRICREQGGSKGTVRDVGQRSWQCGSC